VKTFPTEIELAGGNLRLKGDWRIEGRLDGRIECDGALVIGPEAHVSGEILAETVIVEGRADAIIVARERCELAATARVDGGVTAYRLKIAEGAFLCGRTQVGLRVMPAFRETGTVAKRAA
jgi:cytoskeletal protein CcmA (bactofilin family)